MDINHFILLIIGGLSAVFTFVLQHTYKQGAVRASAIVGVLVGLFVLIFPNVLSPFFTKNLPLVCFGASFVGMVSSKILSNYFLIGLSGAVFTIIFINTSAFFYGFGGGLGSAACIALLVILSIPVLRKRGKLTHRILQLKKLINDKFKSGK